MYSIQPYRWHSLLELSTATCHCHQQLTKNLRRTCCHTKTKHTYFLCLQSHETLIALLRALKLIKRSDWCILSTNSVAISRILNTHCRNSLQQNDSVYSFPLFAAELGSLWKGSISQLFCFHFRSRPVKKDEKNLSGVNENVTVSELNCVRSQKCLG